VVGSGGLVVGSSGAQPQMGHLQGGVVDVGCDPGGQPAHAVKGHGMGPQVVGVGSGGFVVSGAHPQMGHLHGGVVDVGCDPGGQPPHIVMGHATGEHGGKGSVGFVVTVGIGIKVAVSTGPPVTVGRGLSAGWPWARGALEKIVLRIRQKLKTRFRILVGSS
jgi:hypothetical protein